MNLSSLFLKTVCWQLFSGALAAASLPVTSTTVTGAQITSLTVGGEEVPVAQLIPGTLSTFTGASTLAIVAPDQTPPAINTRADLLGDLFLNTGVTNPAATATACTFTFAAPVVNRPGPDIVVFELNTTPATDGIAVRINATSQTYDASLWGNTGLTLSGLTDYSAGVIPASLAELQTATLTSATVGQSLTVFGIALELSDFGIAAGASITTLSFGSRLSNALFDPVLIMGLTSPQTNGPVISEIMASNRNGIEDEDTDRSDWVEIYNGQAAPINLADYRLSDDPAQPAKWIFPSLALPAYGTTFVFASGKNRYTNLHAHTNFTLKASGGQLFLRRPDSALASTLTWGQQQDDISYGTSGNEQVKRFFETPTPSTLNSGRRAIEPRVDDPVFSRESGVLTAATTLTVSLPPTALAANGAVLRYTTDGTDPLEASPLAPASFDITSSVINQNLAVKAFQPDRLPSRTVHRNFIWLAGDIGTDFNNSGAPFTSNLPIVVLDSYGVAVDSLTNAVLVRPYRTTQAAIYEVDPTTSCASLAATPTLFSRSGTHVRGQSSASYLQKPYAWEFWKDTSNDDKKVELLGMPADSDWVLQTLYTDKTFQRNYLMQQLMLEVNGAGPGHRSRFVEVFYNQHGGACTYDDYRGIYLLMEATRLGNNRLRIEKLNSEMTEPAKLSGGYIFAKDKNPIEYPITPQSGPTYDLNEPLPPTAAQSAWLTNYLNQTDTALRQSSFATPSSPNYYGKWLDARSFIDKQIFQETCKESDSYVFSYYYYKDRGQPLKADLLWDVDRSLGNSNYASADTPFGWRWWSGGDGYVYFPRLFLDPEFTSAYWDRWWSLRQGLFATPALLDRIEATALQLTHNIDPALIISSAPASLQNPAARHFRKYPTLGFASYTEAPVGQVDRNTYRKELDLLKSWLSTRLTWIDSQSPLLAPVLLNTATGLPRYGGIVSTGYSWQLDNPNTSGTVLYTIDGSDPRQIGGSIHPEALTATTDRSSLTTIIASGSSWKWLRPSIAPAAEWKAESYNDATWSSGLAPIGYGESSGLSTNISRTPPSYTSNITEPNPTYFRSTFSAPNLTPYQTLQLEIQADDGAVIYLNGLEVARVGYPLLPVPTTATVEASGLVDDPRAEAAYNQVSIPTASLREGLNTLAVEVHQGLYGIPPSIFYPNNSYSDMRFDLRLLGLSKITSSPQTQYTLTAPGIQTVRSRISSGSTWSGLTEATFIIGAIPATSQNLVISEIHYSPVPPTPAEISAGFLTENFFEYIELRNIHPTASLDLSGLSFTQGITFSFNNTVPSTRYLPPGATILLIANTAAFTSRLPANTPPLRIAGTYLGSLSNSGETLTLIDATGTPIQSFAYGDQAPWSPAPDGTGPSLVLIQPNTKPDPSLPYHWRASTTLHGTPGASETTAPPPAAPLADNNQNGYPDQIDYLLGSNSPLSTSIATYLPAGGISSTYLIIHYPCNLAAAGSLLPELSTTLSTAWSLNNLTFVGWDPTLGTQSGMTWRSTAPLTTLGPRAFIRLRSR